MTEAEKIIDQYIEKFGGFPLYLMQGMTDEEIAEKMKKCLKTGKPLEVEFDQDADY